MIVRTVTETRTLSALVGGDEQVAAA